MDKKNYGETEYLDPIENADKTAAMLKEQKNCDIVVCLSHLGYEYTGSTKVSDVIMAQKSRNIDLIIGGHTHTFLAEPVFHKNQDGKKVLINQVGWAGINLGKIEISIEKMTGKQEISATNLIVKSLGKIA